jgi:hypothetical protein
MKSNSNLAKKIVVGIALLMMAGWLTLATAPATQPLSKDDITLLLLGSTPSKIIQEVEERGIDFQMNADLAKKFHDQGANDDLIDALQKAGNKAAAAKVSAPAPAAPSAPAPAAQPSSPAAPEPPAAEKPTLAPTPTPSSSEPTLHTRQSAASAPEPSLEGKPNAPDAPQPRAAEAPTPAPTPTPAPSSSEPTLHTRQSTASEPTPAASAPTPAAGAGGGAAASTSSSEPVLHESVKKEAPAATKVATNTPPLKDPDPQEIQHIIQEFAAKEKIFKEARNNYTYHQINKVEEFSGENEVTGTYEEEWDILYDDNGKRLEKVTYAPLNTLKQLIITKEDIEGFRNIQPFVLTSDELPDYEITYLGHVKLDELTTYVFRIRPKEFQKDRQYFKGVVYVDDRDLQIVKSEGKQVPQDKKVHGQQNLFPQFSTWREQVDGKFWFPTYTMGEDTLYFENGPAVHMKEIVRYTDYKQFKSSGRILTVEAVDKQKDQTAPATTPPKQ